nr:Retrovirus-related Pol polyprotein from transposon TNT 1-94 [Ipomoea batatas]
MENSQFQNPDNGGTSIYDAGVLFVDAPEYYLSDYLLPENIPPAAEQQTMVPMESVGSGSSNPIPTSSNMQNSIIIIRYQFSSGFSFPWCLRICNIVLLVSSELIVSDVVCQVPTVYEPSKPDDNPTVNNGLEVNIPNDPSFEETTEHGSVSPHSTSNDTSQALEQHESIQDKPNENDVPAIYPRRSDRQRRAPSRLQDYFCDAVVSRGSSPHHLSKVITFEALSPLHKSFSMAVTSIDEPKSYSQAIKHHHWKEAMDAEI